MMQKNLQCRLLKEEGRIKKNAKWVRIQRLQNMTYKKKATKRNNILISWTSVEPSLIKQSATFNFPQMKHCCFWTKNTHFISKGPLAAWGDLNNGATSSFWSYFLFGHAGEAPSIDYHITYTRPPMKASRGQGESGVVQLDHKLATCHVTQTILMELGISESG